MACHASRLKELRPKDINYGQESIADHFTNGTSLPETFHQLVTGSLTLEMLKVERKKNKFWIVKGNRRLLLYRMMERYKYVKKITVNLVTSNSKVIIISITKPGIIYNNKQKNLKHKSTFHQMLLQNLDCGAIISIVYILRLIIIKSLFYIFQTIRWT